MAKLAAEEAPRPTTPVAPTPPRPSPTPPRSPTTITTPDDPADVVEVEGKGAKKKSYPVGRVGTRQVPTSADGIVAPR